jgi:hypothetical protein
MAMAFAGPDLPVPEVRELGTAPSGRAYAISVRHHGRFLEDTPVEQAGAVAPALTRLLVALYRAPAAGASFSWMAWPTTPGNWSTDGVPPWPLTRNLRGFVVAPGYGVVVCADLVLIRRITEE